jgi:hypothetical protein
MESKGEPPMPKTDNLIAYLYFRKSNGVLGTEGKPVRNKETWKGIKFSLQHAQTLVRQRFRCDLGPPLTKDDNVRMMTTNVARTQHEYDEKSEKDPQQGTAADTLTREEFQRCTDWLEAKQWDHQAVRYNAMIKVSRQALYRGDDARRCRLGDLFLVHMPHTSIGPDPCVSLCLLSRASKVNGYQRTEYGFMFRGADPEYCAQGALALYFYTRYHLLSEPPPDFTKKDWFKVKIWPATQKDLNKESSETVQAAYIKNVLDKNGVKT